MGKHAQAISLPTRLPRLGALVLIWLAGLVVGLFGVVCVGARYASCSSSNTGLACRPAGTTVSLFVILAVIATVTAVTVGTHGRSPRVIAMWTGAGLVVLALLYWSTRGILGTI